MNSGIGTLLVIGLTSAGDGIFRGPKESCTLVKRAEGGVRGVIRSGRVILAAVAILATGSAALLPGREPNPNTDPAAGLGVKTPVPMHVMSTLRRSCFDCHSNETRWPWYSSLPVASWLIARDVESGRGQINFSRWTEYNPFDRASMLVRICEMATGRVMPLARYQVLHPEARLSDTDVTELCDWARLEAHPLARGAA